MLKVGRMHRQTGETFVDPTAMSRQMPGLKFLEFATFNSLVLTNTLKMALTNHPEDGHGTDQMGNTTTRLITYW